MATPGSSMGSCQARPELATLGMPRRPRLVKTADAGLPRTEVARRVHGRVHCRVAERNARREAERRVVFDREWLGTVPNRVIHEREQSLHSGEQLGVLR